MPREPLKLLLAALMMVPSMIVRGRGCQINKLDLYSGEASTSACSVFRIFLRERALGFGIIGSTV